MSLYVISDLHLCDRGPRDNFIVRGTERFFNFLDYVGDQNGHLYIMGDLFDWWQCNLSASVDAYREIVYRLSAMGVTYVFGNHDQALVKFIGTLFMPQNVLFKRARTAFEQTIGNRRFAFLHGHEADNYCNSLNPGVGEITAIMTALAEDKNKGPNKRGHVVEDSMISAMEAPINLWRHLTLQSNRRDEMIDNVEKYRLEKKADVVIYGHTHEVGRIGDYHYNTGQWCRDRDTFLEISATGVVQTFEWKQDHAEPLEVVLR
jgi:UDP-2,3-diacylglucosamine pyrophosphatase LpxH